LEAARLSLPRRFLSRESGFYYLQSRYYDPSIGRFINADAAEYSEMAAYSLADTNLFAYCRNNPVMYTDMAGNAPEWLGDVLRGVGIVVGTALFVTAIIASAGTAGAFVGVGAAAFGLSTGAVSTAITATIAATHIVAGGVALFGASDAVEAFSGGCNPIRDYAMGGNQTAYNITSGAFNALGTIATTAGTIGPKALKTIAANKGTPKVSKGKVVGHSLDFFDRNNTWSFRIDATTHGNSRTHYNPHYHVVNRGGGGGTPVYSWWQTFKGWFSRK